MAAIEIGIYVLSDDRLFCDGVLRILRDDPDLAMTLHGYGIVTKTEPSEDLAKAIHVVADGGIWARRRWLNASLKSFTSSRKRAELRARLEALLSEREREVFQYAAMGLGNKELADRLAISEATVKAHLSHIFQKLGVTGRAKLAALYHGVRGPAAQPKVVHPAS